MMISGLQKMTLLDYPGKVACTVFLQGCNFACPFCHNSGLLDSGEEGTFDKQELLSFLAKRKGLLDGVCVSGGEPTLQPGLGELLGEIKALGYPVKLDTNGSRPEVLKRLVADGRIDYVAMDVKNGPKDYPKTVGLNGVELEDIEESLRFLLSGAVEHELRTTVVKELHSEQSLLEMGRWIATLSPRGKAGKLFLQPFVDRESVAFAGLHAPDGAQMARYVELLRPFAEEVSIRGGG